MLTFTKKTTTEDAISVPDKYICVQGSSSYQTIVYTVPAGRKFVGYWYGSSPTFTGYVNGLTASSYPEQYGRDHVPVTMGPSFTFSANSTNIVLIGVESDV
jgi:hypothetical protein